MGLFNYEEPVKRPLPECTKPGLDAFSLRKIAKKFKLGASLLNKMKISSFQM
jgi:hypothetical protein